MFQEHVAGEIANLGTQARSTLMTQPEYTEALSHRSPRFIPPELGKSGHFVTVESGPGGTVRFDTGIEAHAHINTHAGARLASEGEVRIYLMARAERLEFQI